MFFRNRNLTGSGIASIVAQHSRRGFIKSIQRATITMAGVTSNTAAITAVNLSNSVIHWLGGTTADGGTTTDISTTRVALSSSTIVTGFCGFASGTQTVTFEVIEYYPGVIKSVQRGTLVGATTVGITAVNTTLANLDYLGGSASGSATNADSHSSITLTSATVVTSSGGAFVTSGWQVVEYF